MKKKYCYYVAFVLPVFVFWLAGCTDESFLLLLCRLN